MTRLMWENLFKKDADRKNISTFLKRNILFQDLTARELKFVTGIVHLRQYRAQETIFRQNEIGAGMYLIVNGAVHIFLGDETDPAGETVIARLDAEDFFGEISLVETDGRRTATAVAAENSTLIGLFKPDLIDIFDRNPRAGVKIIFRLGEVLGRRLTESNHRLSTMEAEIKTLKDGTPNEKRDNRPH